MTDFQTRAIYRRSGVLGFAALIILQGATPPAMAQDRITFRDCGAGLKTRISEAYQAVMHRAREDRDRLLQCIDRAYLVEHQRHSPSKIVSALSRPHKVKFKCRNLDANASARRIYREAGVMKIDRDFVRDNDIWEVAGTIAHELMHNAGYKHTGNPVGTTLYQNTVPEQIENCVQELRPNPYNGPGSDTYNARDMVGFALDGDNNYVFAWSMDGTVSAGSTTRIHNYRHPYNYTVATGLSPRDIVGMGLDGENNSAYAWLRNGFVVGGTSNDLDRKRAPYRYSLASGYTPTDVVGMAVDGENNWNFAWYRDGRVSAGTSNDLDRHRRPYRYSLAPGYTPADVVGMAIDGENNWVFAFYRDGKVSAGTSDDLDRYRPAQTIITGR